MAGTELRNFQIFTRLVVDSKHKVYVWRDVISTEAASPIQALKKFYPNVSRTKDYEKAHYKVVDDRDKVYFYRSKT